MKTVVAVVVLLCVAVACAERNLAEGGFIGRPIAAGNQPYWFLGGPRTRSNAAQTIQVPISINDFIDDDEDMDDQEEALVFVNDDEDDENSFDDDLDEDRDAYDDDNDQELVSHGSGSNVIGIVPLLGGNTLGPNYWRSLLAKNGGNAGSIMVPDGIIELEGQGIVDEETGETAFFVSREALAGIPDGSVVALVEDTENLGKANKVIVRRRRKGNRRNNKRKGNRRRRRGGNKRRPNAVRVIRQKPARRPVRGGNRRRRVPNVIRI